MTLICFCILIWSFFVLCIFEIQPMTVFPYFSSGGSSCPHGGFGGGCASPFLPSSLRLAARRCLSSSSHHGVFPTSSSTHHGVYVDDQTSPAFLHANSTSHTWIFSAIAELIGKWRVCGVAWSYVNLQHLIGCRGRGMAGIC